MIKKMLMLSLLLVLASSASAAITIAKVSPGVDGNFLTSETSIVFTILDNNAGVDDTGMEYHADITYNDLVTQVKVEVVSDLNLGNRMGSMDGTCVAGISPTATSCTYTWTASAINAISDGNYEIDVNATAYYDLNTGASETNIDGNRIYDANIDSAESFFVDNTVPSCTINGERGNEYNWGVTENATATDVGGQVVLSYSVVKTRATPVYNTSTMTTSGILEGWYETGIYTYSCYATDTAGNVSSLVSKNFEWPGAGSSITISDVPATGIPQVAGIGSWMQDNWLIVVIFGMIAFLVYSGSQKKKKGKKGK